MMIPVNNVGQYGVVQDRPLQELPLNAWTDARNMRFHEGKALKFLGEVEVYPTPVAAPYWLLPVPSGSNYFWLYAGATAVGATDGTTHADITRAAGPYTSNLAVGWTGGIIEGVAVINNGVDVPQMWGPPPALATDLIALSAWDSNWKTNALRVFKRYLVALDVTKTGVRFPHMIKWSDQAPTGAVPADWDETDETIDAGEYTLPSDGGYLVDMFPLRDVMVLYKEYQTWLMQYVGGNEIFRFIKRFEHIGCLSRHCAAEFFSGKHLVFTGDDLVLHDGQEANSVLSQKARNLIRGLISPDAFTRCFVVVNYAQTEVWAALPEIGHFVCTRALVWNWQTQTATLRELNEVAFAEAGIVSAAGVTWATVVPTWDAIAGVWSDRAFDPSKQSILQAFPMATKLKQADQTNQFDGADMTAFLEKRFVGYPTKSDGPPDYTRMKQIRGVYPRISGTPGGVVNVYLTPQQLIGDTPTYGVARPFVIGSTQFVDTADLEASRTFAIKFESASNVSWSLDGYEVDLVDRGMYG